MWETYGWRLCLAIWTPWYYCNSINRRTSPGAVFLYGKSDVFPWEKILWRFNITCDDIDDLNFFYIICVLSLSSSSSSSSSSSFSFSSSFYIISFSSSWSWVVSSYKQTSAFIFLLPLPGDGNFRHCSEPCLETWSTEMVGWWSVWLWQADFAVFLGRPGNVGLLHGTIGMELGARVSRVSNGFWCVFGSVLRADFKDVSWQSYLDSVMALKMARKHRAFCEFVVPLTGKMNSRIPRERERERFCFYDVVTLGYMQPELTVCINGNWTWENTFTIQKRWLFVSLNWHAPLRLMLVAYCFAHMFGYSHWTPFWMSLNHVICLVRWCCWVIYYIWFPFPP